MIHKLRNIFRAGLKFKKEFRRQIRYFIILTLAFTVAFSWRQTTFDLSQSFISWLFNLKNSNESTIITSVFITVFSLVLIYLTSHFLKDSSEDLF